MVGSISGNSNVMPAKSIRAFTDVALKSSKAFVEKASKVTQNINVGAKVNTIA